MRALVRFVTFAAIASLVVGCGGGSSEFDKFTPAPRQAGFLVEGMT